MKRHGYGWCQSCGALVHNSLRCHKCGGKAKPFCIDMELVKLNKRIRELEANLREYGRHKRYCDYIQGLNIQSIEKCVCGFEQALKGG